MNLRFPSLPTPLIALITGAATVFSFAPFGLWPLQIASLALLFYLVTQDISIKRVAFIGWAYGFGWMTTGMYWLFITMHHYGQMPAWLAALAVALLASCVLAPYFGIAVAAATWLGRRYAVSRCVMLLVMLPACWALSEWLRGWVLSGLPWVASGYVHTSSSLAGYAPVLGVYGVGLMSALIAGAITIACSAPFKKSALGSIVAVVAFVFGLGYLLHSMQWTQANGAPISVRLLQGNVAQETKFDIDRLRTSLNLYEAMIKDSPADLIATPETALPLLISQLPPDYVTGLSDYSRQTKSHIALGLLISDAPGKYANSLIGISPTAAANQLYRYDKHHLVPFGEYIPFGFHWFVNLLQMPMADQTPGPAIQVPFAIKDQLVLPNVCYEDLFGEEIAAHIAAAYFAGKPMATILLNTSNLGWFDNSIALPQHLQISQMRVLETGRPMLRATNTGATAVIDANGKVMAQLPFLTRGSLAATVQGYSGVTPYIAGGNFIVVILCLSMLILASFFSRRNRRV